MADGTLKVGTITTSSGSGTITLGQSGETVAFGSGVTSQFNQPAFEAYLSTTTTLTNSTDVKIQYDTEILDTNNAYDNSTNYRFTPQVAGKYLVYANIFFSGTSSSQIEYLEHKIYKNGSSYKSTVNDPINSVKTNQVNLPVSAIIDMNGSTDYVESFGYGQMASGTVRATANIKSTYFAAYRIGA